MYLEGTFHNQCQVVAVADVNCVSAQLRYVATDKDFSFHWTTRTDDCFGENFPDKHQILLPILHRKI